MRVSARNTIQGKVVGVEKGATIAHVRIEIAPGQVLIASITNQAVDDLRLEVGGDRHAVVKATDVVVAVDD